MKARTAVALANFADAVCDALDADAALYTIDTRTSADEALAILKRSKEALTLLKACRMGLVSNLNQEDFQ